MSANKLGIKAGRPSTSRNSPTLSELADKPEMVRVNFDLSRDEHMRLKIYAAKTGQSITEIMRKLVSSVKD